MELSIIIVNWNSREYLRRCLASIFSDPNRPELEVLVVDNASYDGSSAMIHKEFPQVTYIQSNENLGFSRGNNLGYQHSRGRALLFLNPDTEIQSGALTQIVRQLWTLPSVGAAGCRVINSDLTLQTTCLQAFPTVWNRLLDIDYLKQRFPTWRMWGMWPLFSAQETSDEVEMITGACLLVKRDVFGEVRGFNATLFMYGDDLDLCYRLKQAGHNRRYVATAEVVHHGGKSSARTGRTYYSDVLVERAIWIFFCNTRGSLWAAFYRAIVIARALVRILVLSALWPIARNRVRISGALGKWAAILKWALGIHAPAR